MNDYKVVTATINGVWAMSDGTCTKDAEGKVYDASSIGFSIHWEADGVGYGEITFHQDAEGRVRVDTETMSKEFVLAVFKKLVDDMEITDRSEDY